MSSNTVKHRILIVDDEESIRAGLREYAEFLGFDVTTANDGMDAVALCRDRDFDAIIMDVMMPRLDGFSAVKEIKKIKDIPVLMLSARDEEYDKLFGFEVGIDDYVTKPFSAKEIIARLRVLVNRGSKNSSDHPHDIYRFGGLTVNFTSRTVSVDEIEVEHTPREYDLLFYLVKNANIALSREKILCNVWGDDFYGDDRTVDTHIKALRANLGEYKDCIVTLRGIGYRFEEKNRF